MFLQDAIYKYTPAISMFLVVFVGLKLLSYILVHFFSGIAKKSKNDLDDLVLTLFNSIKPVFYIFIALYFALNTVDLGSKVVEVLSVIITVLVTYQAVLLAQIFTKYFLKKVKGYESDESAKYAIDFLGKITDWILWILGVLFVLSNVGVNITSLVTGLGIGGIAVALALQNVLTELFSSFAIYFDKPFVVGDFIVVGDKKGVVKRIGIKTTRIQALQGEELIISNKELTTAQIQNYKRMKERRVSFTLGIVYETPKDKVAKVPQMIKDIITSVDSTRFDRAFFSSFGDFALIFDVVYFVESGDYLKYAEIHQQINLAIMESFEKEGIAMAYPTQTLYVAKD